MHQTTVRFGPDLWAALEEECARLGVSAAQYLREAALARLAYTAGRRGEREYELALMHSGGGLTRDVEELREASTQQMLAATAVSAQSSIIWRRAAEARSRAADLRRMRREMGT